MKTVVGIDEAGRGPLAGPVSVSCVAIRRMSAVRKIFPKTRDSKKLSPKQRETWFAEIRRLKKEGALSYAVKLVGARTIDAKGISFAIRQGISTVLNTTDMPKNTQILLDGGLKAPEKYRHQKTIIKGDEKELSIALASIAAKVTRDRYMVRIAKKYPRYGFDIHKGYGTKQHMQAIRRWGITLFHRKTFCTSLTKHR